jgi:hypothetical protein
VTVRLYPCSDRTAIFQLRPSPGPGALWLTALWAHTMAYHGNENAVMNWDKALAQ